MAIYSTIILTSNDEVDHAIDDSAEAECILVAEEVGILVA
jgi:hypothetical protein